MATQKNTNPSPEEVLPDGMKLTDAEQAKAREEGAKEAVKEAAKDTYTALTDGHLPSPPADQRFVGWEEAEQFVYILDFGIDQFVDAIAEKKEGGIPENKVYGLLARERNGQNRTPYVKAAMKRLGLKSDELPGGGPAYTNDISNITDL